MIFIFCPFKIDSANKYKNQIFTKSIKTLLVSRNNSSKSPAIINLKSPNNEITISFDEMSHEYMSFAYKIIHCNKDWTKSDLNILDYIDGFEVNDIENREESYNTHTEYTHYEFSIPNEKIKFKISGNYVIQIFDKTYPSDILCTACFCVLDKKVKILSEVVYDTEKDFQKKHQQLNFEIESSCLNLAQIQKEITPIIQQNKKKYNQIIDPKPYQIFNNKLIYRYNKELVFDAGNEYRKFEITSFNHNSLNVESTSLYNNYYNAKLYPDDKRTFDYTYDEDQNGAFFIRNTDYSENNITSDYFLVHFSLPYDNPKLDAAFYIDGDFTYNSFNSDNKMIYNFTEKAYQGTAFLKQGLYNYRYLCKYSYDQTYTTKETEGNYWQTENEYYVYVYLREPAGKYDQLIGYNSISNK